MSLRFASPAAIVLMLSCLGCNSLVSTNNVTATAPAPVPVSVAGNWQLASTDPIAASLPALSGALAGVGSNITGVVHSDSPSACIDPSTAIALTGSADASNNLTLTGANVAGGTLKISGTIAADGRSLTNASYIVTGGTCGFSAKANAVAQSFSPVSGDYAGNFSDPDGQVLSITATLSQTPASDANGNFQLSGTGSLGANPCFTSPATISNSQVTGGSFNLTYTDPSQANSVDVSGTFSTDGTTLTVTKWTLSGACGNDSGTGLLTRH